MNARDLHRDAVVVDCHNDLVMSLMQRDHFPHRASLKERWIPELREGGVDVQVLPVWVNADVPEGALRVALEMTQRAIDEVEANPDEAALCTSGVEVHAAVESGRIAFILALEGFSYFATDPGLVRTFHRLGVRMISFTHFGRSPLADGSAEEDSGSRLTRQGVEVFKEMERLGILMDVSHLSVAGTAHVLEIATRPVIASHSNARAVHDHHRNLPDEQIAGIAASGGVVGLNLLPLLVDGRRPTMERLLAHLQHMVEIAGVDHVGLGPDFIVDVFRELYPADARVETDGVDGWSQVPGLANAKGLPLLTDGMLSLGLAESDIRKILGGNFLRVFDAVMGVPAPR